MKKAMFSLFVFFAGLLFVSAQGLKVGDTAPDFTLKNVDGKMVSLNNFESAKGFVVIFTCNHCPYAVAYEDRIIAIDEKYSQKGFPVIAVNPNDPEVQPQDSYEKMKERVEEKGFPFPYLFDEGQKVYPQYGATRTPHVYLLKKEKGKLKVAYIGTIDDNYKDASAVQEKYLENAIDAVLAGKTPAPAETKAIGCSIKVKK